MSNYSTLKAAISAVIKENNNHEITGQALQTTLLAMVDSLAGGYLFKGIATPATVVGTPDENVFYIGGAGTYSNFGATPVNVPDCCIGIFTYNGSFENHIIPTGGVFDISAYNAVGGTPATYADLTAALGTNGANIPDALRKGGMSVKFIQGSAPSSDNNYVKFFCTADEFTTDASAWQSENADNEPTAGSDNLVKSGGVFKDTTQYNNIEQPFQLTVGHFFNGEILTNFNVGQKFLVKVSGSPTISDSGKVGLYCNDNTWLLNLDIGATEFTTVNVGEHIDKVNFKLSENHIANSGNITCTIISPIKADIRDIKADIRDIKADIRDIKADITVESETIYQTLQLQDLDNEVRIPVSTGIAETRAGMATSDFIALDDDFFKCVYSGLLGQFEITNYASIAFYSSDNESSYLGSLTDGNGVFTKDTFPLAKYVRFSSSTQLQPSISLYKKTISKLKDIATMYLIPNVTKLSNRIVTVEANGNGDYTTISSAVDGTSDGDTILVYPGIYNESVHMYNKKRYIVGICKETCILQNGTGLRATPPLEANIGGIYNMTLYAGYYDSQETEDTQNRKSYAIHCDYAIQGNDVKKFTVENCTLISDLCAAIGIGLRYNQYIELNHCELISKCSKVYTSSGFRQIGSLYMHDNVSIETGKTDGKIFIKDCFIQGKKMAIEIDTTTGINIHAGFINNTVYSIDYTQETDVVKINGTGMVLANYSHGNNNSQLNQ